MTNVANDGLLALQHIAVVYPDGHRALDDISLTVQPGEFVVLLGTSGAGKSSLLRSINGLVQPSSGEVRVAGHAVSMQSRAALRAHRQQCAMVFQQHHLIGRQTVLANVLLGRVARRGALSSLLPWSRQDKEDALRVLERVGLLEKSLARADTLSGGQQQRVGIARALMQQPRILLADEPIASLDPAAAEAVLMLLRAICKKDGLATIASLHQVEFARRYADRIIGIRHGRVVFDGPAVALTVADEARLYLDAGAAPLAPSVSIESPVTVSPSQELETC